MRMFRKIFEFVSQTDRFNIFITYSYSSIFIMAYIS